jgi:hypothetical protein
VRIAAALVALLTVAQAPSPQLVTTRVLNGHFKAVGPRYQYLPFDVSAGAESITISYSYSGDDGASVIDLGLFEPGPLTLGTPAFRGYSGGAQRTITVGRNSASPGYRIGPLPAGQWHVLLGMYRVAPGGVDVEVKITESREETAAETVPGPKGPGLQIVGGGPAQSVVGAGPAQSVGRVLSDPPKWYSGALHLHTNHSDGALTPAAIADTARAAGLDFIVVTDHNNTTHSREPMPASPLHIVGEEVTTPGGHADAWGLPEDAWIDFRVSPQEPGAAAAINSLVAAAHKVGALFAIGHPIDSCGGCSWEQVIPEGIDAVEIWQNEKAPRDAEVAFWDRVLLSGRRVTAVGVSDWHRPGSGIDVATVRVLADRLTQPAILDGMRQGHVVVMRDAHTEPPQVRVRCGSMEAGVGDPLTCSAGDELTVHVAMKDQRDGRADFIWNAARMTTRTIDRGTTFAMPAASGYLRVHLYAGDGSALAVTNPIYVSMR